MLDVSIFLMWRFELNWAKFDIGLYIEERQLTDKLPFRELKIYSSFSILQSEGISRLLVIVSLSLDYDFTFIFSLNKW